MLDFDFYDFNEFKNFINNLPEKDRDKLLLTIVNVRDRGLLVARKMRWTKKIRKNLYEIRSRYAKNYQRCLYFHVIANRYVITNYFTKKSNQTPIREINKAKIRRKIYLKRGKDNG